MRTLLTNSLQSLKSLLPNLGKLAMVTLIASTVFVGVGVKSAEASGNYQRLNRIAGENKYIKVCNYRSGRSVKVAFEASQEGSVVQGISINLLARRTDQTYIAYIPNGPNGWATYRWRGYNWERDRYFIGSSGRFFSYEGSLFATNFDSDYDVKFGSQVFTNNGTVTDLGGIINLGKIPQDQCRTYDDGRYY
jgi:hypothetical protein